MQSAVYLSESSWSSVCTKVPYQWWSIIPYGDCLQISWDITLEQNLSLLMNVHHFMANSNWYYCFFPTCSDCRSDGAEEVENERSASPIGSQSTVMDRNPSPPPEAADGEEDEDLDAIGDTVYSKHWLFSTLTRLIRVGRPSLLLSDILSDMTQGLSVKWQLILICLEKMLVYVHFKQGQFFVSSVTIKSVSFYSYLTIDCFDQLIETTNQITYNSCT